MGSDIHIVIQRQEPDGAWREVPYQRVFTVLGDKPVDGFPVAPDAFTNRNYDLFAVLADVRNGVGFAGVETGEGWPSIAPERGLPVGFDKKAVLPNPAYIEEGSRWLGDHSFTWVGLDELKAFDWDGTETWLYGVVKAEEYEKLSKTGETPDSYCGGIVGPGIKVYEPDEYKAAKAAGALAKNPYVRMGWPESARSATYDWPGTVIPWL
jgi:hypothetical protein